MAWVISDRLNDHLIWTAFFVPFFFLSRFTFSPPLFLFYFLPTDGEDDGGRLFSLDEQNGNALAIFQLSKRGTGLNFAPSFFPLYDRIIRLK